MIGIVDYGAGNLMSVKKAFEYLGMKAKLISTRNDMVDIEKLVLPGVGAFGAAVEELKSKDLFKPIADWLESDKPFLGLCLGMQLIFEGSPESEGVKGFGHFPGHCVRFTVGKVPQMGWNQIEITKDSKLLEGIEDGTFFYFLHSFHVPKDEPDIITAETDYGIKYPSIVEKDNVYGIQFHPEKSGEIGLRMLKNWGEKC